MFFEIGLDNTISCNINNAMNKKIEKMSKTIYLIAVKITVPATMLPPLIAFAIDYFTHNLGDESFLLPYPAM